MPAPIWRWRGGSRSTPRSSARASATPRRPCSSTRPSPRSSCPWSLADLAEAGVELVGDERARAAAAGIAVAEASEEDWATEFLDLKLAVGVVDSLEEAIEHVNRNGTRHSEAIVSGDEEAAGRFAAGVDAAVVYTNASTRFTDGFEFGMGAEIGNSTQKLHARGPIGLRELTTYKYVVRGDGQIRE